MLTAQALQELLNHVCQQAAHKAAERLPDYDLPKVQRYLRMMTEENLLGWKPSEVSATIESRTMSGCPDPSDPDTVALMQQCFLEAVRETTAHNHA